MQNVLERSVAYYMHRLFEDAMFESVSALTTTGLTAGVTSVNLNLFSKVVFT
jgi:trk system potassium uptake protein TrkH